MNNVERVREIMRLADEMRVDELVELLRRRRGDGAAVRAREDAPRATRARPRSATSSDSPATRSAAFSMTVDAIHETADPHVVIAEHRSDAVVAENGRPYRNHYVTFFTFDDDGLIVELARVLRRRRRGTGVPARTGRLVDACSFAHDDRGRRAMELSDIDLLDRDAFTQGRAPRVVHLPAGEPPGLQAPRARRSRASGSSRSTTTSSRSVATARPSRPTTSAAASSCSKRRR